MDKIAFIAGENFIYWNSILLALAAATAILIFLAFYIGSSGKAAAAAIVVPLAVAASMFLSRLVHWYCRTDTYESLQAALTDFSSGGYALMGAFFGCALAASLLRLVRIVKNLPQMLDAMALGGAAGIAVGRLACFYNTADRGMIIPGVFDLPWVYPTANAVTGELEYRLATFALQAIVAGALFVALGLFYIVGKLRKKTPDGDTCLLFLLMYGASQVVLDSTRYDSLYLRSNGFISIVQILGAVAIVLAVAVFSVRAVRRRGFHWGYALLWALILACMGGAGYMEYYVQRHGDEFRFAYSVMSGCLAAIVLLAWVIRGLSLTGKKRKKGGKYLAGKRNIPAQQAYKSKEAPVGTADAAEISADMPTEVS